MTIPQKKVGYARGKPAMPTAVATSSQRQRRLLWAAAATAAAAAAAVAWRRYRRRRRAWRLRDKLTVILCTSPVKTNPSTALIEETVGSMRHHAPALAECPTLVLCDGYKVRDAPKYRSGQVTAEGGAKYEAYVAKLRALNFGKMVRCAERQGFGFALKHALTFVRTPYVIVVQHDRNFVRAVDVEPIVKCLERHDAWLKYVGLPTSTTLHYQRLVLSKYGIRVDRRAPEGFDFELTPLLQWYDSTHVCSTRHYREFVYGGKLVKKGGFVEDKLGQFQLAAIREHGMAAHAQFAQFVLNDGVDRPIVAHLDGHDALSFRKFSFVKVEEPGGLPGAPAPGGA